MLYEKICLTLKYPFRCNNCRNCIEENNAPIESFKMKNVSLPIGWRPVWIKGLCNDTILQGVVDSTSEEKYNEFQLHFAIAKLLEHQENVAGAIQNMRSALKILENMKE